MIKVKLFKNILCILKFLSISLLVGSIVMLYIEYGLDPYIPVIMILLSVIIWYIRVRLINKIFPHNNLDEEIDKLRTKGIKRI